MTRREFSLPGAIDMNRYNFKHLPEVIRSYESQLKKAKKADEKARLTATIAEKQDLLKEYSKTFPEGPL